MFEFLKLLFHIFTALSARRSFQVIRLWNGLEIYYKHIVLIIIFRLLGFLGASRPSSIFIVHMFSLCILYNKAKINSRISLKNFVDFQNFQNFNANRILRGANFQKFDHSQTFPGVMQDPTKNLGTIGSAVLTFIGYKQTNKQTDTQTSQIYI